MKQLFVFSLILVLFSPGLHAQPMPERYMKGMLIIKFKPGASSISGGKQKATPKNRVQQMLSSIGSSGLRPVWTPAFERGLQKAKQRGKIAFDQDPAAELRRTFSVKLPQGIDSRMLAAKLSRMPGIAYAEPRYLYKTTYVPNDPKAGVQLPTHNFYDAFDITKGSSDVIIAIVDSGVDYNHEDLNDKLWINQDEIPDNGIDDDNNGFIDDDKGWDFWQSGNGGDYQQDNDPMGEYSDHGTHVAGIAAAETDNGIGVAGTGFNSIYMAVKAGGIQDDPNTPDNESDLIGFGYEGIMYAANNGADVINCSWGGGGISQFGEDAINFATQMGALVVAAAGNESTGSLNFPAADKYVLSVGSVDSTTDQKSSFSNFGYDLDVLADGLFVRSTVFNNSYGIKSGTSMSTPVVSGLAALIKAQHPGWSAMRINRQIRGSARSIDDFNPQFANRLGKGAIDAQAALQDPLPGIMVRSADFLNTSGGKLFVGENGTAELKLVNYGAPTSDLNISLSTPDDGITISSSTVSVGALATDDSATVTFDLSIAEDFNLSTTPLFRVDFAASGNSYSDFNYVRYDDILYDVLAANNVKTSFGANGTIGFTNPQDGTGGVGFIPRQPTNGSYQEGDNMLFEGGLMLEINGTMADAVRGADNTFNRDFRPLQNYQLTNPGSLSDIDGHMAFDTGNESTLQALSVVNMSTYAFNDPELSNVVFVKYEIRNTDQVQLLDNVYVGLFNDWDIGNSFDNNVRYSETDSLLYVYESGSNGPYVAVAQLGNTASNFAIDNGYSSTEDSLHFSIYPDQGTYSGFGDKEKQWSLHARDYVTQQSNTDISTVVSSGPYEVRPGATITVGFVYAFGNTLNELQSQVAAARAKKLFQVSTAGEVGPVNPEMPHQTTLYQNYPNPFNPSTIVKFDISESGPTSLRVYDVLGRRVATVFEREMRAGSYAYQYTPRNLSSGVYLMVLQSPSGTETVKFSYLK